MNNKGVYFYLEQHFKRKVHIKALIRLAFGYCTVALSLYVGMNWYHIHCFYVRLLFSGTL